MAKEEKKDILPSRAGKSPERESRNERSTAGGHPKRQTEGPELHRVGEKYHMGPQMVAVRGVAAELGTH